MHELVIGTTWSLRQQAVMGVSADNSGGGG
jgi:hypothetical protein